jgi:hypothetical protein
MKKLISLIIVTFIVFSSVSHTFAKQGQIEKIINLEFAVESIEFSLSKLPKRAFSNQKVEDKYNHLKQTNELLIKTFNERYQKGKIDYYTAK